MGKNSRVIAGSVACLVVLAVGGVIYFRGVSAQDTKQAANVLSSQTIELEYPENTLKQDESTKPDDTEAQAVQQVQEYTYANLMADLQSVDRQGTGRNATATDLNAAWDNILEISTAEDNTKSGILFTDSQNPTLYEALHDIEITGKLLNNTDLASSSDKIYIDTDELSDNEKLNIAVISYYDILDVNADKEFDAGRELSRAEFMSMLSRATNPLDTEIRLDENFVKTVGTLDKASEKFESNYLIKEAQQTDKNAYLSSANGLSVENFTGTMTKLEALNLIVNSLYAEELETAGVENSGFTIINSAENHVDNIEDHSVRLGYMESHMDANKVGVDELKVLVVAREKGLLNDLGLNSNSTLEDVLAPITKQEAVNEIFTAVSSEDLVARVYESNGSSGEIQVTAEHKQEETTQADTVVHGTLDENGIFHPDMSGEVDNQQAQETPTQQPQEQVNNPGTTNNNNNNSGNSSESPNIDLSDLLSGLDGLLGDGDQLVADDPGDGTMSANPDWDPNGEYKGLKIFE